MPALLTSVTLEGLLSWLSKPSFPACKAGLMLYRSAAPPITYASPPPPKICLHHDTITVVMAAPGWHEHVQSDLDDMSESLLVN